MFSPLSDMIGEATGLWKSVPKHPVILALAIKDLLAKEEWSPEQPKLRAAMKRAREELLSLQFAVGPYFDALDRADEIIFTFDRAAWDRIYADVDGCIPLMMAIRATPPRTDALDDLWRRKETASTLRIAACETKPVKRTKRAKGPD
jgi:hypothetical protein